MSGNLGIEIIKLAPIDNKKKNYNWNKTVE